MTAPLRPVDCCSFIPICGRVKKTRDGVTGGLLIDNPSRSMLLSIHIVFDSRKGVLMKTLRALTLAATLAAVCVLPVLAGPDADPAPCVPGTPSCPLAPPQSVQVNPHPLNADGTSVEIPTSGGLVPVEVVVPMPAPRFVDPLALGSEGGSAPGGPSGSGNGTSSGVVGSDSDLLTSAGEAGSPGVGGAGAGSVGAAQALALAGLGAMGVVATASQALGGRVSGRYPTGGAAGRATRVGGNRAGGARGGNGAPKDREERMLPRASWIPGASSASSGHAGAAKAFYTIVPPPPTPSPTGTPEPEKPSQTATPTLTPAQTITPIVTQTPQAPPGFVPPPPLSFSGKTIKWLGKGVKAVQSIGRALTASAIQFVAHESGYVGVRVGDAVTEGSKIAFRGHYGFRGTRYNPSTVARITGRDLIKGARSKWALGISAVTSLAANLYDYGLGEHRDKGILSPEFAASTMVDYGLAAGAGLVAAGTVAIVGGLATAGLAALGLTVTAPLWLALGATAIVGVGIGLALDHFGVGDGLKAKVVDGFKAWGGIADNAKVIGAVLAQRTGAAVRQSRDAIISKAKEAGNAVGGLVSGIAAGVTSGVRKAAADVKGFVQRAGDTIAKTARGVGTAAIGLVGGVLGKVRDSVDRIKSSLVSKLPKVTLPKVSLPKVSLPKITLPKVSLPKVSLPKITLPKVSLPKVSHPKITLPKVSLPKVSLPKISAPKVSLPKISAPKISWPKLGSR